MAPTEPVQRVDVHTHFVPRSMPELSDRYAGYWPRVVDRADGGADILLGDRHFRTIDERSWDLDVRLADMDTYGVRRQVISPIPIALSYGLPAAGVTTLARFLNEWLAEAVQRSPGRVAGFGTAPLQDPDRAAEVTVECVRSLGLAGIEIGTNVDGMSLDDPSLEPFFAAAEEVSALLFVHPVQPMGADRLRDHGMAICLGMPFETAQAASALVLGGVLDRHPGLTVVLAHGGGAFPWVLPRIDRCWETGLTGARSSARRPSSYARRFYYDALVYEPGHLAMLVELVGADRLVVGTDYPFAIAEQPPGNVVDQAGFSDDTARLVLAGNAEALLP